MCIDERHITENRPIDVEIVDTLLAWCVKRLHLDTFAPEARSQYIKISAHCRYWHGTGRLQYQGGRTIDVLEQGGLIPAKDTFDYAADEMMSISVARHESRIGSPFCCSILPI